MTPQRTVGIAFAVFLVGATVAAPGSVSAAESARDFLQALGDDAVAILAEEDLSEKERELKLGRLFDRGFHLPTVSRFVLGRHWRTATPAQREEYQQVFRDFIVKSYSKRFSAFSGERLEVTGTRQEGERDTIVSSRIVRQGDEPTRVAWRVRGMSSEYKIIDVIVEGVSMLITQRDEFSAVIRKHGGKLEGLITELHDKVRALE